MTPPAFIGRRPPAAARRGPRDARPFCGTTPPAGLAPRDLAVAAALLVVTLALYAPVRGHEFLNYDDNEYVTEHPLVRTGLTRASVTWALTGVHHATWHPLTTLSHLADVELFGLDAGAHLLVNVVLHALATVVLFLVLRAATGARWPSAFVAAAFAWHPLHVESVAWVSERKDALSGLFWMLTLAAYVGYAHRPTWARWLAVAAVFALGLLAKPMLVTLPFVLLLLDVWPLDRVPRGDGARAAWLALVREKLPLFALAAAMSAMTVVAQRSAGALAAPATAPLGYRVGNALLSYVAYLRKTVWPSDLAVFYPPRENPSAWAALAAALFLAAVTLGVVRAARRAPWLAVGWLWYLGTLVPVIGLVRQGDQSMADRFTYLPSIGLFVMVAWSTKALREKPARTLQERPARARPEDPARRRAVRGIPAPLLATAGALVLVAWLVATSRQLAHWQNSLTLFTHALEVDPDDYLAHGNLGIALDGLGRHAEAMAHFERAVAIQPGFAKARINLGHALARAGRSAAAEAEYRAALRLDPKSATAAYDLGLLLAERGDLDAAIPWYRRALDHDPTYAKAWNNLGWALAAKAARSAAAPRDERNARAARAATDPQGDDTTAPPTTDPRSADAATAAVATERTPDGLGPTDARSLLTEAVAAYERALAIDPTLTAAHNNLAVALEGLGREDDALVHYAAAVRLAPREPRAHANYAALLADRGRTDEAVAAYREALRLAPDLDEVRAALAALLAVRDRAAPPPPAGGS